MIAHEKRYMLRTERWWDKKYLVDRVESDTLDEIIEYANIVNDLYADAIRPDISSMYKYPQKERYTQKTKWGDKVDRYADYIFDDDHYWWGYAVLDFETEKIIMQGGQGFRDHPRPVSDLRLYDNYFRKPDEIPADYKWDTGEYAGWLQFRWGDGENAIEKVRARKAKLSDRIKASKVTVKVELKEADKPSINNTFEDELDAYYDSVADKELVKYKMDKYGW